MCIPSSSYVCLVINPKQHCQTLTTETVKINTKGLGREILRSQREGNFKGVSWKLRLINHHELKETHFSNCIMPFYRAKNNRVMVQMPGKKNHWKTSQTFMFKEKARSRRVIWWEPKCPALVASSLPFGMPLASNRSVMLKVVIYTKHVIYM